MTSPGTRTMTTLSTIASVAVAASTSVAALQSHTSGRPAGVRREVRHVSLTIATLTSVTHSAAAAPAYIPASHVSSAPILVSHLSKVFRVDEREERLGATLRSLVKWRGQDDHPE